MHAAASSTSAHQLFALAELLINMYHILFTRYNTSTPDIIRYTRGALLVVTPITALLCAMYVHSEIPISMLLPIRSVFTNSAVCPFIFALTWRGCTSYGVVAAVLVGQIFGLISWLACAYVVYGSTNFESLTSMEASLAASIVPLMLSPFVAVVVSYFTQGDMLFEWGDFVSVACNQRTVPVNEEKKDSAESWRLQEHMQAKQHRKAVAFAVISVSLLLIVWPLLTLPMGIFSTSYFAAWMWLTGICVGVTAIILIFLPVYEAYQSTPRLWRKENRGRRRMSAYRRRSSIGRHDDFQRRLESLVQWEAFGYASSGSRNRDGPANHNDRGGMDAAERSSLDDSRSLSTRQHLDISSRCRHMIFRETYDSNEIEDDKTRTIDIVTVDATSFNTTRHAAHLHRCYMWLTNGRDIQLSEPYPSAWETLRFIARAKTVVFVGACSTLFSVCISIMYVAGGFAKGCIGPGLHAIFLAASFLWFRFVNLRQKGTENSHIRGMCMWSMP